MDRSTANVYVYAKASGMLAKSYVGKRASKLFSAQSMAELWSLLFSEEPPVLPEKMLAEKIEQTAEKRFVKQYVNLIRLYDEPDEIFKVLLQSYEFENLKTIGAALHSKKITEKPDLINISPYNILKYDAWPDITKITNRSILSWYNKVPDSHEQKDFDLKLDVQLTTMLMNSISKLPDEEQNAVTSFFEKKMVYENILWAMRLKVYYQMNTNDITNRLLHKGSEFHQSDKIVKPAIEILGKSVNSWDDWSSWKYVKFINPNTEGAVWELDPAWFEQSVKKELSIVEMKKFHSAPLTALVLIMWFLIKQDEVNTIRTATEALRLEVDSKQAMQYASIIK